MRHLHNVDTLGLKGRHDPLRPGHQDPVTRGPNLDAGGGPGQSPSTPVRLARQNGQDVAPPALGILSIGGMTLSHRDGENILKRLWA